MLILTRKKDESFVIGDNIRITVVEVSGERVKIGIEAPSEMRIIRNELYDTERFNIQAVVNKPSSTLLDELASNQKLINTNSINSIKE